MKSVMKLRVCVFFQNQSILNEMYKNIELKK